MFPYSLNSICLKEGILSKSAACNVATFWTPGPAIYALSLLVKCIIGFQKNARKALLESLLIKGKGHDLGWNFYCLYNIFWYIKCIISNKLLIE